jgi:hypothetical protein
MQRALIKLSLGESEQELLDRIAFHASVPAPSFCVERDHDQALKDFFFADRLQPVKVTIVQLLGAFDLDRDFIVDAKVRCLCTLLSPPKGLRS